MINQFLRAFWRTVITLVMYPFVKVEVEGLENLPEEGEMPLVLIANHFSYLDPLILMSRIPRRARFLAAIEMTKIFFFSHILKVFEGIPVWRGQVDRTALKTSIKHLEKGGILGVFPEGGIIPELQEAVARGEKIVNVANTKSRLPAVLANARPGTAYIAAQANAYMLPVAMIGTQNIEGNVKRFPWKRTYVKIVIGEPYGPMAIDPSIKGRKRRQLLEEYSDLMMAQIAELMPPEHRGAYVDGVRPKINANTQQFFKNPFRKREFA